MAALQSRARLPASVSSERDGELVNGQETVGHDDHGSFVLFDSEPSEQLDASTASTATSLDTEAYWSMVSSTPALPSTLPAHDGRGVFALSDTCSTSSSPPVSTARSLSVSSSDLDTLELPSSLSSADEAILTEDEDEPDITRSSRSAYPSPPPEPHIELADPVIVVGRKRRHRRSGMSDRGSKRSNTSSNSSCRPAVVRPAEQTPKRTESTGEQRKSNRRSFFLDKVVRNVFLVDEEMLGMLDEADDGAEAAGYVAIVLLSHLVSAKLKSRSSVGPSLRRHRRLPGDRLS
jgi:hypothetical protein